MLPPKPRTLDDVKAGELLVDDINKKRFVLARIDRLVNLSQTDKEEGSNFIKGDWYTIQALKDYGYKFADQPEERWKPEYDESYWYVDEYSETNEMSFVDDDIDQSRWDINNCFKTEAEAKKAAEELKEFWRKRNA